MLHNKNVLPAIKRWPTIDFLKPSIDTFHELHTFSRRNEKNDNFDIVRWYNEKLYVNLLSISQWNTWQWQLQLYRTYHIESQINILLVMVSWLLERVHLPPSVSIILSRSYSPLPLTLPFCHVCRGAYRMATGFLFSGNVLDDWKATWRDLRGTTCRRFIIFFLNCVSSGKLSFWGARRDKYSLKRIVVTGLAVWFLPFFHWIANVGGVYVCPCSLKWSKAGWGHEKWMLLRGLRVA